MRKSHRLGTGLVAMLCLMALADGAPAAKYYVTPQKEQARQPEKSLPYTPGQNMAEPPRLANPSLGVCTDEDKKLISGIQQQMNVFHAPESQRKGNPGKVQEEVEKAAADMQRFLKRPDSVKRLTNAYIHCSAFMSQMYAGEPGKKSKSRN